MILFEENIEPKKRELHQDWENAANREKRSRTCGDLRAAHPPLLPDEPRAPFPKDKTGVYAHFLVYAWIQRSIGGLSLRAAIRAFSLLNDPPRLLASLDDSLENVGQTWQTAFREPIGHVNLHSLLEELREGEAIRFERLGDLDLKVNVQETLSVPDMPPWTGVDADLSLRAALAELATEPIPSPEAKEPEIEHFEQYVATA